VKSNLSEKYQEHRWEKLLEECLEIESDINRGNEIWKSVAFHLKDTFGVMIELTEYNTEMHSLIKLGRVEA